MTGWNNKVKEVKTIKYEETTLLLVQVQTQTGVPTLHLVQESKLTARAKRYLYTFIPDEDSDSLGEEEISKLDLLIKELK